MKISSLSLCLLVGLVSPAWADVTVPSIFSEHAVLQKLGKVPIWGKADPAEKVTVTLDKVTASTQAGPDGKWRVNLDLSGIGQGPFSLVIAGKNTLTIPDVVVGDVWVCSGQSNMAFHLSDALAAKEEIAGSANPMLRNFDVGLGTKPTPQDECRGVWTVASPEKSGSFSAVGYFFGKKLQRELKVPVGLIHTSWGGTPVEAWMSAEGLSKDPDLKAGMDRRVKYVEDYPKLLAEYGTQLESWQQKYQRADKPTANLADYVADTVPSEGWKTVTLPAKFQALGLPNAGAMWLRKKVQMANDPASHGDMLLVLGIIKGFETVYLNGQKISEATPKITSMGEKRVIKLLPAQLKEGENTLCVRIYNPAQGLEVLLPTGPRLGGVPLSKEWEAKAEYEFPALDQQTLASFPVAPSMPEAPFVRSTHLFNAMINPLIPYGIKGAIWYQGESNADRAFQYRTALSLMISDWRSRWEVGDFPFYLCQLANYMGKLNEPRDSDWAELRESQAKTLAIPNTGMAVLVDIGEEANIHPKNKKDAGERLALVALAKTYGKNIPYSGPTYDAMSVEGDKVRLKFQHLDGGLDAKPVPETFQPTSTAPDTTRKLVRNSPQSELEGFMICGEDRHWKWADAKIDGATVVVSSPAVPKPVAVRYAWENNPTCNLYNKAGLPAVPFRTDDFPPATLNRKY